jgi:hypothetical protein
MPPITFPIYFFGTIAVEGTYDATTPKLTLTVKLAGSPIGTEVLTKSTKDAVVSGSNGSNAVTVFLHADVVGRRVLVDAIQTSPPTTPPTTGTVNGDF